MDKPKNPIEGQLWEDNSTGKIYAYINHGWIPIVINKYKDALEKIAGFTDVFDCHACIAQKIAKEALNKDK